MTGLTRRQFSASVAGVGLAGAPVWSQPLQAGVLLRDGAKVPPLGLGTFRLAEGRRPASEEEEALRIGISLGLKVIDTAEMYGDGSAEEMVGRVIAGQREKVFLVSKVFPHNATADGIRRACLASLKRLNAEYLDMYLLHWIDGTTNFKVVVEAFEKLKVEGRIKRWGVSNFEVKDMEALFRIRGGDACATNQVRYNLTDRRIERDLIPWCDRYGMPIMAYSPLGKGDGEILKNAALLRIAETHQTGAATIALAWTIRSGKVITFPTSGAVRHVQQNAAALALRLSSNELLDLDRAFPL